MIQVVWLSRDWVEGCQMKDGNLTAVSGSQRTDPAQRAPILPTHETKEQTFRAELSRESPHFLNSQHHVSSGGFSCLAVCTRRSTTCDLVIYTMPGMITSSFWSKAPKASKPRRHVLGCCLLEEQERRPTRTARLSLGLGLLSSRLVQSSTGRRVSHRDANGSRTGQDTTPRSCIVVVVATLTSHGRYSMNR